MKYWAIWDKNQKKVLFKYEHPHQLSFGGPWGSAHCCQHEITEEAFNKDIEDLDMVDETYSTGTERVQIGTEEAHDDEGNPILDHQGNPVELPIYTDRPILGTRKVIK